MSDKVSKNSDEHICIGILAHVDAGKTTLSEAILYLTGSIRKIGRVDDKDTFLDTYSLEKERGITIFSKQAELQIGKKTFTLLDTPGHVDFSAEMERTLQVLDYAILVISGADGVQGHTETLWRLLKQYQIPTFIFVNKMDQIGTDKVALMEDIKKRLSDNCVDILEDDENLMENLAMCDEQVLEYYLEHGEVLHEDIVEMIAKRQLFPCYFGSALKLDREDNGVNQLLESLESYTKAPMYGDTFGARVFKISRDSQGARLTHMKITGGSLKIRTALTGRVAQKALADSSKEAGDTWEEKVNQIRIYNGSKYENVEEITAGSVCAVTGLNYTRAGDGLGMEQEQHLPLLEPVLTYKIELPEGSDVHKVLLQLRQLEEEEPELHIVWEELSGEILVQLMGEIQTEVLREMIQERFNIDVHFGTGKIVYKETILEPVEGVGHFEPLRHYAEVHLLMEPDEPGSGLTFSSSCSENALDKNWQRLILTHLEEKVHRGVLTGAPITDMKITLIAGRAHQKHTEGGDFRQATYRAVRQGLKKAKNVLLEPYYEFRLEIPQNMVGRAMTDIEQMYGKFELLPGTSEEAVLTGMAPVVTMRDYQKEVASYTGGKGRIQCTMAGYYPCHNSDEVLENTDYDSERDLDNPTGSVFCAHGAGFVIPWYEVDRYMHIAGTGIGALDDDDNDDDSMYHTPINYPSSSKKTIMTGKMMSASLADDKELEEIFRRTYGETKPRKQETKRVIKAVAKGTFGGDSKYIEKKKSGNEQAQPHYLLVDGYNVMFSWDDLNELSKHNMDAARNKLMEILSNYQGYTQMRIILVFDAYKVEGFQGEVTRWHNIDVVFTKEAETADQYIEKTAHEIGRKYKVTVATSDGLEQVIIRSQGCLLMSSRELQEEIERVKKEIREEHLKESRARGNYLLNYLSDEEAEEMEKIRLGLAEDKH